MRRRVLVLALVGCVTDPPLLSGGSGFADATTSDGATTAGTIAPPQRDDDPSTGSSTSTGDDPSVGFIQDPDGWHPAIECSMFDEDCPPGEKCMPWANDGGNDWNASRCVPIARDAAGVGEPCTVERHGVSGIDDCELHAMCWNVDPDTGLGTCFAFCVGSPNNPTCLESTSRCVFNSSGFPMLCLPMCDPLVQDCPGGHVCVGVGDDFLCVVDASGDMGAAGDPCEYLDVCDPGLTCTGSSDCPHLGCCSAFCPVPDATPCLPGQACVPWFDEGEAPPGYEDVGVCMVPR